MRRRQGQDVGKALEQLNEAEKEEEKEKASVRRI